MPAPNPRHGNTAAAAAANFDNSNRDALSTYVKTATQVNKKECVCDFLNDPESFNLNVSLAHEREARIAREIDEFERKFNR